MTPRSKTPAVDPTHVKQMALLVAHLDAAYNLARWLLRNEAEAEDAVQEAYLRAFQHFNTFRGGDGRAWLLTIVRNRCYDRLKQSGASTHTAFDEQMQIASEHTPSPEYSLLRQEQTERVGKALNSLPPHLREVLILREFEEMSYTQIAAVVDIPVGTVMSRLSRARQQLRQLVFSQAEQRCVRQLECPTSILS